MKLTKLDDGNGGQSHEPPGLTAIQIDENTRPRNAYDLILFLSLSK